MQASNLRNAILVSALTSILGACGGGGGSDSPPPSDVMPDAITFSSVADVDTGEMITSESVTISGITGSVPIAVSGGEYSIDGSAFTRDRGSVANGQKIKVRAKAPDQLNETVTVVVTVGTLEARFSISTLKDNNSPSVEFRFPPPVSMTDRDTVLVRGIASDDYGLKSIDVNGMVVEDIDSDGETSWQVEVPLLPMQENSMTVTAVDIGGNTSTSTVMVRQAPPTTAFPDASYPAIGFSHMDIDKKRNRLLAVNHDSAVHGIDLLTGGRETILETDVGRYAAVVIDESTDKIYVVAEYGNHLGRFDADGSHDSWVDSTLEVPRIGSIERVEHDRFAIVATTTDGKLIGINADLTDAEIISSADDGIPDGETPLIDPFGIVVDGRRKRYLVTSATEHTVYSVDANSGEREEYLSLTAGSGDPFDPTPDSGGEDLFAIDACEDEAIALLYDSPGRYIKIDLATGHRTLLAQFDDENPVEILPSIAIHTCDSYAFVSPSHWSIYAIDMKTGHRVVFSSAAPSF